MCKKLFGIQIGSTVRLKQTELFVKLGNYLETIEIPKGTEGVVTKRHKKGWIVDFGKPYGECLTPAKRLKLWIGKKK